MQIKKLIKALGNTDLILIDQILKGRFVHPMRILDAGCGEGRNMMYFVQNHYSIYGIDKNPDAVKMARLYCQSLSREFEPENIQPFTIEENPFPEGFFDAVISINVLHAARDESEFYRMFDGLVRMVRAGGLLLVSLQSKIGLPEDDQVRTRSLKTTNEANYFYLSEKIKSEMLSRRNLSKIEPVKTILTDDLKSHSYLMLQLKT